MAKFICILTFLCFTQVLSAQTTEVNTIDYLYLKNGAILKGDILSFDEEGGGIVFKDKSNRTYSLSRKEYDYFIEDRVVQSFDKEKHVFPAKDSGFQPLIGFSSSFINYVHHFIPDVNFINAVNSFGDTPICYRLGLMYFKNRFHSVGFTLQIAQFMENLSYFDAGLRYEHQFFKNNSNLSITLPIEVKIGKTSFNTVFSFNDTLFQNGNSTYPVDYTYGVELTSLNTSLGVGMSKRLKNDKKILFSLNLLKNTILSDQYDFIQSHDNQAVVDQKPSSRFNPSGVSFDVIFYL